MKEEKLYLAECTIRVSGQIVWTSRIVSAIDLVQAVEIAKSCFNEAFCMTPNTGFEIMNIVCYPTLTSDDLNMY